MTLCNCDHSSDAFEAIDRLQNLLRFLDPRPSNPDRTLTNPQNSRVEKNGSIMVRLLFTHPFLGRDATSLGNNWSIGVAGMTYHAPSNSVQIRQINSPQGETSEELVQGLSKLAEIIAPALGAAYGTLDIWTDALKPRRVRKFRDIRYWCYANVFNPKLLASAPEGFFEDVPCANAKVLSDQSIMLISCTTFAKWYSSTSTRISRYLAERSPEIKIFRQSSN